MVHVLIKNADIFLPPSSHRYFEKKEPIQPERETRNDKSRFILTLLSIRIFQCLIYQWLSFQVIFLRWQYLCWIGYFIFYVWSKPPFTLSIFDLGENFNHYDCLYCCGYQLAIFSWQNQLVVFSLSEWLFQIVRSDLDYRLLAKSCSWLNSKVSKMTSKRLGFEILQSIFRRECSKMSFFNARVEVGLLLLCALLPL